MQGKNSMTYSNKLALIYDRLNKIGGAEHILEALHSLWPQSPWYTSVYKPEKTEFTKGWTVFPSILNTIPFLNTYHELVPFLMPYVFENIALREYHTVISVGSAEAKGVLSKPETLHLNYCLTPTRYLWSHKENYLSDKQFGLAKKIALPIVRKIFSLLAQWDLVAAHRPDVMIAISEHVKKRINKYYNRKVSVIYPPVNISNFHILSPSPESEEYFLTVSRLVPYKRLEVLIDACEKAHENLIIIGIGANLKNLKKIAGRYTKFLGQVNNSTLVSYYSNCKAFLQANEEDFGIAMVEAQASGKPVIAYGKGGASEIVTNNTGILVNHSTPKAFLQAFTRFETMSFDKAQCTKNAKRFDIERFKVQFREKVREEWFKHKAMYA